VTNDHTPSYPRFPPSSSNLLKSNTKIRRVSQLLLRYRSQRSFHACSLLLLVNAGVYSAMSRFMDDIPVPLPSPTPYGLYDRFRAHLCRPKPLGRYRNEKTYASWVLILSLPLKTAIRGDGAGGGRACVKFILANERNVAINTQKSRAQPVLFISQFLRRGPGDCNSARPVRGVGCLWCFSHE